MTRRVRNQAIAIGMLIGVASSAPLPAQSAQTIQAPRPTPAPPKVPVIPAITVTTLANGLRLVVIENHTLPLVAVRFGLAGGILLDPPGKEGAWVLMTTLLREGTTMRSAASISDAAADLGTPIDGVPQFTGSPAFTTVPSAWKPMLELVADMLQHPSFPPDAFARVQATQAATAAHLPQTGMIFRVTTAALFGADHPYAHLLSESSIKAITRDDIVAMQTTYLRPQNTNLVIAGDVNPAEAKAEVERAFGSWERGGTTVDLKIETPAPRTTPTTIYLHDDPGAAVTTTYSTFVVPNRSSADGLAIEALDKVVGKEGRVFQAFRVDHGISYSPQTGFSWRPEPNPSLWQASFNGVAPAKTDSAVIEWVRLIHDAHQSRPITADELDFARRSLVGSLPSQFGTIDAQANRAIDVLQNRLPTTFFAQYAARVNALTLADLQRAADRYLDADHMVIAVVGDRAKIEAPLRATGIPVVIVP